MAAERIRRERRTAPGPLLENPATGETRLFAGFDWVLFLFAGLFLGVPLFLRGLYRWGAVILALWIGNALLVLFAAGGLREIGEALAFAAFIGVQLWLGIRGSALTAEAYRRRGWVPARRAESFR